MTSTYKIISRIYENYSGNVSVEYIKVTFEKLCEIKNINIKKLQKLGLTKQSSKRDSLDFPSKYWVANLFGKKEHSQLFNDDGEAIVSSQYSTIEYIVNMGFKPEVYGFNSNLLKVAA